jgi:hypothetical protein
MRRLRDPRGGGSIRRPSMNSFSQKGKSTPSASEKIPQRRPIANWSCGSTTGRRGIGNLRACHRNSRNSRCTAWCQPHPGEPARLSRTRSPKPFRRCPPPPKPFAELFQISACFVQAFPNIHLAVLWNFNRLRGSKPPNPVSPNFSHPWQLEEPTGRGEGVVIVEATWEDGNTGLVFPKGQSMLFPMRPRGPPDTQNGKEGRVTIIP